MDGGTMSQALVRRCASMTYGLAAEARAENPADRQFPPEPDWAAGSAPTT
jgi:hypothetical protein